ncbi:hypothetical protein A3C89_01600 [Candidatus Kaiserbacteria bacterium RIFCSPHIGHO2_02_FULL_50_50]|uniref:RecF/RecN/SMC N-terminal domain-containing protein n=1 Tax=Candidatus Kaiserbacteria bacterium RIFCSPHIGHO2_02_FULL_50_50 TaxID=1798492 RepID=A0A1F6DCG3_9BACT|nr:MAG: hypothetical protein A3C89_01600 [Candidatus Kaiserbacteria bacterium RIFCSPHIGHO2_02_FULL_50_50]OGG88149.1 MAG: hypothetical protein A3G62_02635 [Candidatus Kaiserbacteria bacterium RIFCSPLOWO2_12_FULL_50_10]
MLLKELTINGFKSFAKKSDLLFSSPITAIVGPNGSGKSNVAESFRFVLGEQATSRMRGKKGEDLIFGGSEKVARLGRATVTATFDNSARVFPTDFDELIIERTVARDGSNDYTLNGARVRLKDVLEMLASANIGTTGHHIISQGEADRILTASPKLRREMIEDALGLRVYQYKIAESEKKLEKTHENIARVESLRRETHPHLQFLERQVKKYERALELRDELATAYADYLRREAAYLAETKKTLTSTLTAPREKLAQLMQTRKEAEQKIAGQSEHHDTDTLSAKQGELSRARHERDAAARAEASLDGQIGFLERRIAHLRAEHAKPAPAVLAAPIAYDVFATTYAHISRAVEQALLSVSLDEVKTTLRNIHTSLGALAKRAEVAPQKSLDLSSEEGELEELRVHAEDARATLRAVHERVQVLEHQCGVLRAKIEADTEEARELRHKVELYDHEIRELEREITGLIAQEDMLRRDDEAFNAELQEAVVLVRSKAMQYLKRPVLVDGAALDDAAIAALPREGQLERKRALERLKIRLEELGGVNEEVIREYNNAKERDAFLAKELADLGTSSETLLRIIAELNQELTLRFTEGLEKIDEAFNRFFARMFVGGVAHVLRSFPKVKAAAQSAVVSDDEIPEPTEEDDDAEPEIGVEIDVRLPNKRVRGLDMLSGGERALTSIALIFAMSQINPPPFIILDETDAALDEANSRRYGDALSVLAERSQLILITHNRETMSRAGVLYGITMGQDGISRMLSIKLEEAIAVAK